MQEKISSLILLFYFFLKNIFFFIEKELFDKKLTLNLKEKIKAKFQKNNNKEIINPTISNLEILGNKKINIIQNQVNIFLYNNFLKRFLKGNLEDFILFI